MLGHVGDRLDQLQAGNLELPESALRELATGSLTVGSSHCIEGADHLQVELRADPHGVGVDQFPADVSTLLPTTANHPQSWNSIIGQSVDQFLGLVILKPVCWLVPNLTARSPMEVIEAEAPFIVLMDPNPCQYQRAHAAPPLE
ncbi:hypothetical protein D3C78_1526640 [compost metagenome]